MKIHILTLFPEMFPGSLGFSIIGKAIKTGKVQIYAHDLRDYAVDGIVDDTPYGGGCGMVMRCDVVDKAIRSLGLEDTYKIYPSPRGYKFSQGVAYALMQIARNKTCDDITSDDIMQKANKCADIENINTENLNVDIEHINTILSEYQQTTFQDNINAEKECTKLNAVQEHNVLQKFQQKDVRKDMQKDLLFLCCRYEGVDQRALDIWNFTELSLGDFVLCGGEVAVLAMLEACIRLLPGVVGKAESLHYESFGSGSTDYMYKMHMSKNMPNAKNITIENIASDSVSSDSIPADRMIASDSIVKTALDNASVDSMHVYNGSVEHISDHTTLENVYLKHSSVSHIKGADIHSIDTEHYHEGLYLEHDHYTKPAKITVPQGEYVVPDILLSGDHSKIKAFRDAQSMQLTFDRRYDLWEKYGKKKNDS